MFSQYDELMAH